MTSAPAPDLEIDDAPPLGRRHSRKFLFLIMGISAIACIIASAVLSIESYHLALNRSTQLGCNFNEVINCGAVAVSKQATFFGFPNAFIGLATEPVVLTIAVAGFCGVRFPRWFMFSAQIGYLFGLIFAYWLFYQSFFNIGALCPWCLTITLFTTITFFTMLHINIMEKNLYLPAGAQRAAEKFIRLDLDVFIPAIILLTLLAGIIIKYGPTLIAG